MAMAGDAGARLDLTEVDSDGKKPFMTESVRTSRRAEGHASQYNWRPLNCRVPCLPVPWCAGWRALFSEELGVVVEVAGTQEQEVTDWLHTHASGSRAARIGQYSPLPS